MIKILWNKCCNIIGTTAQPQSINSMTIAITGLIIANVIAVLNRQQNKMNK
ncbi:hypothetical protein [Mucilaginibacter sp.]